MNIDRYNRLYEDIESMKKYYPNIPEEDFQRYIELDPTYKKGSNVAGKYAKWILALANKQQIDNDGHITDLLTRFDSEKNNLVNPDIMRYKSMQDVEDMLDDESSYKELSHRQEVRSRQKDRKNADLNIDADLVYEDDNWQLWTPKTYAASCKLGQGSKWCTASTENNNYYNSYTKNGPLYILLNKRDKNEKFQFHNSTASLMDINDNKISCSDLFELYLVQYDMKDTLTNTLVKLAPKIFNHNDIQEGIRNRLKAEELEYYSYTSRDRKLSIMSDIKKYTKVLTIDGNTITYILEDEFKAYNKLTSVIISQGVTRIGSEAFANCKSLQSITIPDSVTSIGSSAFYRCSSLTSIRIPDSVTSISSDAFANCDSLTIKCNKGSYAEKYAEDNNIPVEYIGSRNESIIKEKKMTLAEGTNSKTTYMRYSEYLDSIISNFSEEQVDKEIDNTAKIAKALEVSKADMMNMCIISNPEDDDLPDWQNYTSKDRLRRIESATLYVIENIKLVETHNSGITYLWFANYEDATLYTNIVKGIVDESKGESKSDTLLEGTSDKIDLEYKNLEIEVCVREGNPNGYYDSDFGNWLPDEDEFDNVKIDYTYKVDKDDVLNYLEENCITDADRPDWYDIDNEEADKWTIEHFDELFSKYIDNILDYFEDEAREEAEEKYKYDYDSVDWDLMPGGHDDI